MGSAKKGRPGTGKLVREAKALRTYRLTPAKIEEARRLLGVSTATAAIETALDMVVFRHDLIKGTDALFGMNIKHPDASE